MLQTVFGDRQKTAYKKKKTVDKILTLIQILACILFCFVLFLFLLLFFYLSLMFLICVPVHVLPLPVYPGSQVQRYEPIVLVHCAFT